MTITQCQRPSPASSAMQTAAASHRRLQPLTSLTRYEALAEGPRRQSIPQAVYVSNSAEPNQTALGRARGFSRFCFTTALCEVSCPCSPSKLKQSRCFLCLLESSTVALAVPSRPLLCRTIISPAALLLLCCHSATRVQWGSALFWRW